GARRPGWWRRPAPITSAIAARSARRTIAPSPRRWRGPGTSRDRPSAAAARRRRCSPPTVTIRRAAGLPPCGRRASSARDAEDRAHLAGRHAGAVGRGAGARADAHAALRARRVRGHPLLPAARRTFGHLPAARARRATIRIGPRPRPRHALVARADRGRMLRHGASEPPARVLPAADRV